MHILTWKIFQAYIAFIFGEKKNKINILQYPCDYKYTALWGNMEYVA